jgi:hypothetical protein
LKFSIKISVYNERLISGKKNNKYGRLNYILLLERGERDLSKEIILVMRDWMEEVNLDLMGVG